MGRDYRLLFAACFCLHFGVMGSSGIVGMYAQDVNTAAALVGTIVGSFAITSLLFKFIAGPALDSFNRKRLFIMGLIGLTIAYIGFAMFPFPEAVLFFMLLRGACQAFTSSANLLIAADILEEKDLVRGIAVLSLAMVICQAAGPTVALNLVLIIGYQLTFLLLAGVAILGAVLVLCIQSESRGKKPFKMRMDSIIEPKVFLPSTIQCLISGLCVVISGIVPLSAVAAGIPQEQAGLFFAVDAVMLVILRPKVASAIDKYGFKWPTIVTLVFYFASFVVLAYADNLAILLIAAVLQGIGFSAGQSAMQALALKLVPPEQQAAAMITSYIFTDFGSFAFPMVSSIISSAFGYTAMYWILSVPILIAIVLSFFLPAVGNTSEASDEAGIDTEAIQANN